MGLTEIATRQSENNNQETENYKNNRLDQRGEAE
jgi:hypothetical protein